MTENTAVNPMDAFALGPIDILVLEFSSTEFKGEILRNLYELVEAGTIRIIDLVVIKKSKSGLISALEMSDLGAETQDVLAPLRAVISEMLTNDDVNAIGRTIPNNSAAAVLVYENTWALKTKKAMLEAGARFVAFERIPHDVVVATLQDLAAMRAEIM